MKKICHIVFEKYPLDDRVRRYCKILRDSGFDVYVICSKGKDEKSQELVDGVKVYRLPVQKLRKGFIRRFFEYSVFEILTFFKIIEIYIKHGIRIYHIQTLPDFLVFSTIFPKLLNAKIILDFHELFPEFMLQQTNLKKKSLIISFIRLLEKISLRYADYIVTIHDPAKQILLKRNNRHKDIRVIMNAIEENEALKFKKEKNRKFRLVYHGTVNFNMNLISVLKAIELIKESDKKFYEIIEFYIYGEGPALPEIINYAKKRSLENVRSINWLKYSDIVKELGFASAIIIPPERNVYSELYYSLKLLDAIFYKIPVIVSDLKTYLNYFPRECLNYFNAGDVSSLAKEISFVAKNYDKALAKTEIAYKYYKNVNWSVMKKRYNDLINDVIR